MSLKVLKKFIIILFFKIFWIRHKKKNMCVVCLNQDRLNFMRWRKGGLVIYFLFRNIWLFTIWDQKSSFFLLYFCQRIFRQIWLKLILSFPLSFFFVAINYIIPRHWCNFTIFSFFCKWTEILCAIQNNEKKPTCTIWASILVVVQTLILYKLFFALRTNISVLIRNL